MQPNCDDLPAQTLHTYVGNLNVAVEGAWDIDCIIMPLIPSALSLVADVWCIGGSPAREPGLPSGLDIANSPWKLRLVPVHGVTSNALGDQLVAAFRTLNQHPVLLRPRHPKGRSLYLSSSRRTVHHKLLSDALTMVFQSCQLFLCGYGMKMGSRYLHHELIRPVLDHIRDVYGDEAAERCWGKTILDYGWQTNYGNSIILCQHDGNSRRTPWVSRRSCHSYSMYGQLGDGYGGISMGGIDGSRLGERNMRIIKVCVYPGAWQHRLKAAGLPPKRLWTRMRGGALRRIRTKIRSLLGVMSDCPLAALSGVRIEFRVAQGHVTWLAKHRDLVSLAREIFEVVPARIIPVAEAIRQSHWAAKQCEHAGLWADTQQPGEETIPVWKIQTYSRLSHTMGLVTPTQNKKALMLAQLDARWRPGGDTAETQSVRTDPDLSGFPRICMTNLMTKLEVRSIGRSYEVDSLPWDEIARRAGMPGQGQRYYGVARNTLWRRTPGRRSSNEPGISATYLAGKAHVGLLGHDLLAAVCNLIALNLEGCIQTWC